MYSWYSSLLNAIGGRFSAAPSELGEDSELYAFFHSLNAEEPSDGKEGDAAEEKDDQAASVSGSSSSSDSDESPPRHDRFRVEWVVLHNEFSQLLKADHRWAVSYFKHPSVVRQLLSFVVNPPDAQAQLSKNAASILTGTNNCSKTSRNVLFEDSVHFLDILFGPWIHPQPDPPLPRSFSNTVASVILQLIQYSPDQMVEYFQQRWIAREDLAKPDNPFILIHELLELPGLLGSLFRFDEPPSYRDWLVGSEIINLLVQVFSGAFADEDAITQASDVLEQISSTSYTDSIDLDLLFQNAFLKNNTETATAAQISALSIFAKYARSLKSSSFVTTKLENIRPPLSIIAKNLPHLIDILKGNDDPLIATTAGMLRPFGMKRLRILELIETIIETQNKGTHDLLLDLGVFSHLLDLCALYKWNSILQSKVLEIFKLAFQPFDWPTRMIEDAKIHEKISQVFADNLNPDGVSTINRSLFVELLDTVDRYACSNSAELENLLNSHESWTKMKDHLSKFIGDDDLDAPMANDWGNLNDSIDHIAHSIPGGSIIVTDPSALLDDEDNGEVILHDDEPEDYESISSPSSSSASASSDDAPSDASSPTPMSDDVASTPAPAAEQEDCVPSPPVPIEDDLENAPASEETQPSVSDAEEQNPDPSSPLQTDEASVQADQ